MLNCVMHDSMLADIQKKICERGSDLFVDNPNRRKKCKVLFLVVLCFPPKCFVVKKWLACQWERP
jgi:hypothetical protein